MIRRSFSLLFFLVCCVSSVFANKTAPVLVAKCGAVATSCVPAVTGGHSLAAGQFEYTIAYRSALTAPTLATGYTVLDTNSASVSSFRSGCAVLTTSTPNSNTWTNATLVISVVYSGVAAQATADCATAGVGFHTATGATGTTSTITLTGGTLTNTGGSSTVIAAVGSSAAVCLPAAFTSEQTTTNGNVGDIPAGTGTYATSTCTGTTGNWKSDTVELLAASTVKPGIFGHGTASSTSPATDTFTPTTGQAIIIHALNFYGAGATGNYAISDSAGNSWSVFHTKVNATTQQEDGTAFCAIANGSSSTTVSVTYSGTINTTSLEVFHGTMTNGSCTADATNSATGTTGVPTGTVTPVTDDVVFMGATYASITGAGTGFTIGANDGNGDGTEYATWSKNTSAMTVPFAGTSGNFILLMESIKPTPAGATSVKRHSPGVF